MARLELSKMISAPARAVFDYVDLHDNYPDLMRSYSNFEPSSPRHQVGGRLKMRAKTAGRTIPMELETTAVEPGRRITWRFVSGMTGGGEWRFEPVGNATKVTMRLDYTPPMGVIGWILDRLLLERDSRRANEQTLETLRQRCESQTVAG